MCANSILNPDLVRIDKQRVSSLHGKAQIRIRSRVEVARLKVVIQVELGGEILPLLKS